MHLHSKLIGSNQRTLVFENGAIKTGPCITVCCLNTYLLTLGTKCNAIIEVINMIIAN